MKINKMAFRLGLKNFTLSLYLKRAVKLSIEKYTFQSSIKKEPFELAFEKLPLT